MVRANKDTHILKISLEIMLIIIKSSWTIKWFKAWTMQSSSRKSQEHFLMNKKIWLIAIKLIKPSKIGR
jgi:hypothetical protein